MDSKAKVSPDEFKGKVAIVTGSSSGIGQAIALMMAERGASVTLCGRDEGRLQSVRSQCHKVSGGHRERFITVAGDLNDKKVRQKILDDTIKAFGQLDVLIPNAGISLLTSIATDTEELYDLIMGTNLKSVYFLIQIALPQLEKTKGNIVCVSSLASTQASAQLEIYALSKTALDKLVVCLALSQAPKGIRVNAINPTLVPTRIIDPLPKEVKEMLKKFGEKHPLGGRPSTPEEQAEMVTFLASDRASFVTGQCVKVDGGASLAPLL